MITNEKVNGSTERNGLMKKLLLVTIFLFSLLSACSIPQSAPSESNENKMVIHVKNHANFEFYSITVNASLKNGGGSYGGVSNADGSKIRKGDTIEFDFDKEDYHLEGEAVLTFGLLDKNGETTLLNEISLELSTNQEYHYEITGDSKKEAKIARLN
ncbi:hypothetical protein A9C19_03745 [Bacillus weihaiensis]|uniref:Uncharacterized protein n=2 Tax=Bacillus weihaiensis TaxID=1547283 RepID=A0A1L3MNM7_9BACI|nr:hypothetical protein A9C19_03745 [Bacillus weihaiensis]